MKTTITILGIIVLFITSCGVTENVTNYYAQEEFNPDDHLSYILYNQKNREEIKCLEATAHEKLTFDYYWTWVPIDKEGKSKIRIYFVEEGDYEYIKIYRGKRETKQTFLPQILNIRILFCERNNNDFHGYDTYTGDFYNIMTGGDRKYLIIDKVDDGYFDESLSFSNESQK